MRITKIHYFDTYEIIQGHRRFTKIGFEAEMDDEFEDVRDVFYKLKRKSEELFYESKGAAEKQIAEQEEKKVVSTADIIIDKINTCDDAVILERDYKNIASKDPVIKVMYDLRLKQLQ